ncbi:MAG: N-acetylgalactosamine-4-sulfatase, partial [Bryobacteraceae bacterium]
KNNVAAANPQVVEKLKGEYDAWWKTISVGSGQPVRIVVGNPAENPVRLTAHDWHGEGANAAWNQKSIRKAPLANGYWTLRVERTGRYRFELCRWPKEVGLPINAAFEDKEPNRVQTPGKAIHAVKARVKIGTEDRSIAVNSGDKGAVFDLKLAAGPADLHTFFIDADGAERGAYFVYVTKL